jgi:hypothetical protein
LDQQKTWGSASMNLPCGYRNCSPTDTTQRTARLVGW